MKTHQRDTGGKGVFNSQDAREKGRVSCILLQSIIKNLFY
jgi:hypothetical protein